MLVQGAAVPRQALGTCLDSGFPKLTDTLTQARCPLGETLRHSARGLVGAGRVLEERSWQLT